MNTDLCLNTIFQDNSFLSNKNNQIVILNFSTHRIKKGIFPEEYPVINFPLDVNVNTPDLDLILLNFVKEKLINNGYPTFNFMPLVILPNYQSIQLLIYHIISELWDGVYPITTRITRSKTNPNLFEPSYFVPGLIKKRLRRERDILKQEGLIIN
jgi:hypothetical protein